jgi:hypothetical protein
LRDIAVAIAMLPDQRRAPAQDVEPPALLVVHDQLIADSLQ